MRLPITHLAIPPLIFNCLTSAQNNCNFRPISIPLTWVSLSNNASIRGAALSFGSPPQTSSLLPSLNNNNTYVYFESKSCSIHHLNTTTVLDDVEDIKEPLKCISLRGGVFDPGNSSTYINDSLNSPTNKNWAPNERNERRYLFNAEDIGEPFNVTFKQAGSRVGSDTLTLIENVTLLQFPFATLGDMETGNNERQANLGLGRNSSLLRMLKSSGKIGSSSFGYWWGLDGGTNTSNMEGSLVLGGYDRAKVRNLQINHTGNFVKQDDSCFTGMAVTINEIQFDSSETKTTGRRANLLSSDPNSPSLGSNNPLHVCLCPEQSHLLALPYNPYSKTFGLETKTISVGNSTGINRDLRMYPVENFYQGNVTIVLDSGFSVVVPNSQLVIPDLTLDQNGQTYADDRYRDIMLRPIYDLNPLYAKSIYGDPYQPCLGRAFFTSAYLYVDNDAQTFTLWEANPTSNNNLVSVTNKETQASCSVPQATSDAASPSSLSPFSGGAIAGTVIGTLSLLGTLAYLLYWVQSRSRAKKIKDKLGSDDLSLNWGKGELENTARAPITELPGAEPAEIRGDPLPPQELWPGKRMDKSDVHELP